MFNSNELSNQAQTGQMAKTQARQLAGMCTCTVMDCSSWTDQRRQVWVTWDTFLSLSVSSTLQWLCLSVHLFANMEKFKQTSMYTHINTSNLKLDKHWLYLSETLQIQQSIKYMQAKCNYLYFTVFLLINLMQINLKLLQLLFCNGIENSRGVRQSCCPLWSLQPLLKPGVIIQKLLPQPPRLLNPAQKRFRYGGN